MSDSVTQAVADEIANEIWILVDSIRAEVGVPMTRQDELRILNIRRKLTRRLVALAEDQNHGETATSKEVPDPKGLLAAC